jgi:hypothetical protein
MTTEISRLSPYNVTDTIVRAALYREIRAGSDDWPKYEIQPDEILRPELTAYRHYGTDELKWVVLIAAHLDDYREALPEGETISLPPSAWIRERIIYYQGQAAAIGARV